MVALHNITVEDSSPLITYTDIWQDSPRDSDYDKYSGYATPDFASSHRTNATSSLDFLFNGTAIYVFGTVGPNGGPFDVALSDTGADSGTVETSNGTSKAVNTAFQSLLYSHVGLNATKPHQLHVTNSGQGEFILDYVVVQNEVGDASSNSTHETTWDDEQTGLTYSGNWSTTVSGINIVTQYLEDSSQHVTNDIGAQATIAFRGSGLQVHGVWFAGGYSVTLDGQPSAIVQSNITGGPGYNRPRELYMADGLSEDNHTVVLTNIGDVSGQWHTLNLDYTIISTSVQSNLSGLPDPSATSIASSEPTTSSGHRSTSFSSGALLTGCLLLYILRMFGLT